MWVPAPLPVIEPGEAGVDPADLTMPPAFDRLAAPPVFVCGSARSGTTWTFDLFDRHPEVHAICESWILSQTHGITSILAQSYWSTSATEAWRERVDAPFGAIQSVPYEEVVQDLGALVADWFMKTVRPEHRFLVAKEPIDVRATAILFPEARFIHVVRDGRDVALSMKRASETWDPSMGVGLPMEFRAEAWRRQVENVRAHRDLLGDRYLEIRYEAMRADPESAMRTVFDFAEIPYGDELLQSIRDATKLSSYSDAPRDSGFRGGSKGGGWREVFTPREARAFDRAAGELLAELGYDVPTRKWRRRPPPASSPEAPAVLSAH
jgi:hypothetical protein